jgi:hypothetical protein
MKGLKESPQPRSVINQEQDELVSGEERGEGREHVMPRRERVAGEGKRRDRAGGGEDCLGPRREEVDPREGRAVLRYQKVVLM